MKHTKGNWRYDADEFIWAGDEMIADPHCSIMEHSEQQANASRIVACVNACAGMAEPGTVIDGLANALEAARLSMASLKQGLDGYREMTNAVVSDEGERNYQSIVETIKAALKAVKEVK